MTAKTKQTYLERKKLSPSDVETIAGLLEERQGINKLRKDVDAFLERRKLVSSARVGVAFRGGNKIEWDLGGELSEKVAALILEDRKERLEEIEKAVSPIVDLSEKRKSEPAPVANGKGRAEAQPDEASVTTVQ